MERVGLSGRGEEKKKKLAHSPRYTMEPCEMLGRRYVKVRSRWDDNDKTIQ